MCSEFWDGWFDWWGGVHHTTDASASAAELDAMLAAGASVNLYMLHGGTNFGTSNGANDNGRYTATLTSYDYDAPLDEGGYPTEKFYAFRDVIAKYTAVPAEHPAPRPPAPTIRVSMDAAGDWVPNASDSGAAEHPQTFEELGHLGPLVRYDVPLPPHAFGSADAAALVFSEVRDLAWVSVDGRSVGRLSRGQHERALEIPRGAHLTVLVEDQGRVNYARRLGEAKGLMGPVEIGGMPLTGWTATVVDVAKIAEEVGGSGSGTGRTALRGSFDLEHQSDLYLDTALWGKGYVFVNGSFLGRHWNNGPQRTLFTPAPVTRTGRNEVTVLELEQVVTATAHFVADPQLGNTD